MDILRDFPSTLKAGIFIKKKKKKKKKSLLSLESVFDFFHYTRSVEDKARYIWKNLEIIESVVSSPFVKAEAYVIGCILP